MIQSQAVIDAPQFDEGTDGDENVKREYDRGDDIAGTGDRPHYNFFVDGNPFPGCLAGDSDIDFLFDPIFGNDEQQHGQVQQQYSHGCAALHIVIADRLDINLCGQRGEIAADSHWIGKISHGFDEDQ